MYTRHFEAAAMEKRKIEILRILMAGVAAQSLPITLIQKTCIWLSLSLSMLHIARFSVLYTHVFSINGLWR